MSITPSGKRRIQVAQALDRSPAMGAEMPAAGLPMQQQQPAMQPEAAPPVEEDPQEADPTQQVEEEGDTANDISDYIFKKLEEFGYPERRLHEYEEEFVEERIFSEGNVESQIVIPDRHYGTRKRLSESEVTKMINEIQKTFNLTFQDAERKNKKITMNFISLGNKEPDADPDALIEEDTLSEVYGPTKDDKSFGKGKKKKAYTMDELLKTSREELAKKLSGK